MNGINIISLLAGTGAATPAKPLAGAQAPQGLAGFLNLVFAQVTAQGAAGGVKAPLQNLPGQNANATAGLAEKISALLQSTPADVAGIQNLLQNMAPQDRQTLAGQVAALLQNPAQQPSIKSAALIRDLTASLAPDLQQAAPQQTSQQPNAKITQTDLADLLNSLQPGSGDAASSKIMQLLAAQGLDSEQQNPNLDPSILDQLKAQFAQLQMSNGAINHDALVAFKADATRFLQDQGFDPATVQQYLTAFAKTLRPAPQPQTVLAPMPDAGQAAGQQSAQQSAEEPPPVHAAAAAQKPVTNIAAAAAPTLATAPQQPVNAGQAAKATTTPMVSHPALVNALTGGTGDFSSGDFSQQSGQQSAGAASTVLNTDSLRAMNDTSHQGFANYMTAARQGQGPTTQMVALQIQRNAALKVDTFHLQLHPAELGKLEIRLKFGKDGAMKAHLIADKPETLALLQKDSAQLERVLQQTGLELDDNALSFDLRQQSQHQQNLQEQDNNASGNEGDFALQLNGKAAEKPASAVIAVQSYGYISPNGVNITV